MDKPTLGKNQIIQAHIEGYGADGAGIARHQGMVVFVPNAARGDTCLLRVVKVLKNRAYGRIEQLLQPSPHREENQCPAFPRCGGCDFRHISYEEELGLKARRVADAMARLGGFDIDSVDIVPSAATDGYRNKAQFPVGTAGGQPVFGFYRRHSHDIVAIDSCAIHDARASALARAVRDWAALHRVPVYNQQTGAGLLRHIYVRTGSRGCHLCIVAAGSLPHQGALVAAARQAAPDLTGVALNINKKPTNVVLGGSTRALWGSACLEEELAGRVFGLSPQSFFQVNRPVTQQLYGQIMEWCGDYSGLALDLYCGIGTITLALAGRFDRVMGVEIVPQAIEDARQNATANGAGNAEFICADAAQAAQALAAQGLTPQVVVCDPPRKGMDSAALDAVAQMAPDRIIYVACDPSSLARDAAWLRHRGWQLRGLRAFDMFPRTANVETVALLERQAQSK